MKKLAWMLLLLPITTFAAGETPLKLMIPMYFYPHMTDGETSDPDWLAVAHAGERVPTVAIVNIGNGLQDEISEGDVASYLAATELLDEAGVRMIGYVSSDYACNSVEDIKARIDRWHEEWPLITGIFVDETQNKLVASEAFEHCPDAVPEGFDYTAFYKEISGHINAYDRFDFSVFNPGTDAPDELVDLALVTVSFESTGASWITDSTGDSQAGRSIPAMHFAAMVYDTGELTVEELADWISDVDSRNYGWVHFTDDNGWSALPSYMEAFVAALECHNDSDACDDNEPAEPEPAPEPELEPAASGGGAVAWLLSLTVLVSKRRRNPQIRR